MEASLISILIVGAPILAAPVALIWGLRRTLIGVIVICILMMASPYVYFGIWGLFEGAGLWSTWTLVAVSWPAAATIVGWILVWSTAYGALVAGLRLAWIYWRSRREQAW